MNLWGKRKIFLKDKMPKSKVDCHFFLTGSCRNGASCPFRHSEGARNTQEICAQYSQTGQCPEDDCGKRHTTEKSTRQPPSEVPCRNEENGGVCKRPGCIFKHRKTEDTNMEWVSPAQRGNMEWTPNEQESSKIPTIYEILGIPEDPPVDPIQVQRNRRIQ